jgi:hypothetical protein
MRPARFSSIGGIYVQSRRNVQNNRYDAMRRYTAAAAATMVEFRKVAGELDEVWLQKFAAARGYPQNTHPDIAIIST